MKTEQRVIVPLWVSVARALVFLVLVAFLAFAAQDQTNQELKAKNNGTEYFDTN